MEKEDKKGGTYIAQQFNFGKVEQINYGVETVINYPGAFAEVAMPKQKTEKSKEDTPEEQRDLATIHDEILDYVDLLNTDEWVYPQWKERYRDLWINLLDLPEVAAELYNKGKQHDTSFNRSLIGNIIHHLGNYSDNQKRVYKNYNATHYAIKLENNKNHSIRGAMYNGPSKEIKKALDKFLDNYVL